MVEASGPIMSLVPRERPPPGDISATLCDCDEIEISIRDAGVGIDDDNTPHLFDAFFTTKPHGMGMGLAICRSIVEGHRGACGQSGDDPTERLFLFGCPLIRRR
jgi:nitrogen-specific signal transduction histidine kinase